MTNDKVTLKDVYAVVNRLEDKVDKSLTDYGNRMDTVENKVSNIEGRNAIYTIVFSGLVSVIVYNVKSIFGIK